MKQTTKELEEENLILDVFAQYLADSNKDFVYSDKFGLLCVSAWSVDTDAPYDVVRIKSAEHLLEVLAEMLAIDHLAEKEQICFTEEESKLLYDVCMQQYAAQLAAYQAVMGAKLEQVIRSYTCSAV